MGAEETAQREVLLGPLGLNVLQAGLKSNTAIYLAAAGSCSFREETLQTFLLFPQPAFAGGPGVCRPRGSAPERDRLDRRAAGQLPVQRACGGASARDASVRLARRLQRHHPSRDAALQPAGRE